MLMMMVIVFFRNEKKNKIVPGPWPYPQARNKAASHDDGNDAADNEKSPSRERSKYFAWLKGRAQNQKDNPSALFNNNITKYFHFHSFHFLHQSPPAVAPPQNFDIKLIILKKNLLLLSLWVFFVFRWPFRIYGHFGTFRPNFFKRKC